MRRARLVLLAFGLLAYMPLVASAHSPKRDVGNSFFVRDHDWYASRDWPRVQCTHGAALLDPNAAGAALTLLVGSVAVVASKRRKNP